MCWLIQLWIYSAVFYVQMSPRVCTVQADCAGAYCVCSNVGKSDQRNSVPHPWRLQRGWSRWYRTTWLAHEKDSFLNNNNSMMVYSWYGDSNACLHRKTWKFFCYTNFQSILRTQTSQHTLFLHVRLGIHLNVRNSSLISFLLLLYTSKNQLMWNSSCPWNFHVNTCDPLHSMKPFSESPSLCSYKEQMCEI